MSVHNMISRLISALLLAPAKNEVVDFPATTLSIGGSVVTATGTQINAAVAGGGSGGGSALGTTNDYFTVNLGSGKPRVKLSSPDTGTGDYDCIFAPPATATAERTYTLPDATGNVVIDSATQTLTNKTLGASTFTGTITCRAITLGSGAYNVAMGSSSGTFATPTGAHTINGEVTLAADKGITADTGTASFDFSAASGTFKTPTGIFTLGGAVVSQGTLTFNLSGSTGAFTTSSGTNTLSGNVVIAGTKTFASGTGTFTINGTCTFAAAVNVDCAAGTTAVDLSLGTGTFKTTTGAHTLGGAVTIADATTPSLTTATGKTNTGFLQVNGKTSGALKITCADATAQTITLTTAAQTSGAATVTLPDLAGVSQTMVFSALANTFTLAQTIAIDDASNTAVTDLLVLKHTTSGASGAGIGAGISVIVENDTDATTEVASIDFVTTNDGTKATLDTDVVVKTMLGGAVTQALLIDASDQSLTVGVSATDADGVDKIRIFGLTASKGSLVIQSVANTGDTDLTILNKAQGQATSLSIGDVGTAAGQFVLCSSDNLIKVVSSAARTVTLTGDLTMSGAFNLTLTTTAATNVTLPSAGFVLASKTLTKTTSAADSLAIPVTHGYVEKTTGGDAEALTLANGIPGQIVEIALTVDGGGDGTLTPATCTGFATIVFADAGDHAVLQYLNDTEGWVLLAVWGLTAAPVVTA